MRQNEHCHDDMFGDHRLVSEYVADRDPFWQRTGIDQVKSCRDRLQQAQPRRRREAGAPNMTNHDLGVGQQRSKLLRIALIFPGAASLRAFSPWKECAGQQLREMAEKQSFHFRFSSSCPPGFHGDRHKFCINARSAAVVPMQPIKAAY